MKEKMRRVTINYSDGRYSWSELPDEWNALSPPEWIDGVAEVPESTYQLWLVARQLDAEIQVQLEKLDP